MSDKTQQAALEGWMTLDADNPRLIGSRCTECGTYYFPKQSLFCRNPHCSSESFEDTPLSNKGRIWSYTNANYQPPEPYVSPDPFEPFTIAAVELEEEKMVIVGQTIAGLTCEDLKVGMPVELTIDTLYEDKDSQRMIWKWQLAEGAEA